MYVILHLTKQSLLRLSAFLRWTRDEHAADRPSPRRGQNSR
ncbi:hypothetical protein [Bosea rubneri]|jgi:hypothetical protein|uniref:Uncharacterized protein n=1 Tax=Bosea rubneri TaxID=3075434 RepID=A0ABU3S5X7_9HYPH|nr:hypothetical protein [Bosea sp. ZW T0_25]MDU0340177.1 hypothetical protein [Bosea sp. ZW T0_25]HEV7338274.1 hypothetical protein [Bosea sp. (in: a-proteobacteria)]